MKQNDQILKLERDLNAVGLTKEQACKEVDISVRTFDRWKRGDLRPLLHNYERFTGLIAEKRDLIRRVTADGA